MRMRMGVVGLAIVVLYACGSEKPLVASGVDYLTVRSLRTGQPVAGAAVEVEGVSGAFMSANDGIVHLTGVSIGKRIVVRATGFADARVVRFSPGATEYLLPHDTELPYDITYAVIYGSQSTTRLHKVSASVVTIVPDATMRTGEGRHAIDAMISEMAHTKSKLMQIDRPGLTSFPDFVVAEDDAPNAQFRLRITFDPNNEWFRKPGYEHAGVLTFNEFKGNQLSGALIVFAGLQDVFFGDHFRRAMIHETGHALGLDHLPQSAALGIMGGTGSGTPLQFNAMELQLFALLMARPSGTKPVDDSSDAGAALASIATRVELVCALH